MQVNANGEEIAYDSEEPVLIMPGRCISKIPYIQNKGASAYTRARADIVVTSLDSNELDVVDYIGFDLDLHVSIYGNSSSLSNGDGTFTINENTPFSVTVEVDSADITNYVKFKRLDTAGNITESSYKNRFTIFINDISITIKKSIAGGKNPIQSFMFNVNNGKEIVLSIVMDPSDFTAGECEVTITRLPPGTYTVSERTDWPWKYTLISRNNITVNENDSIASFISKRNGSTWLGGLDIRENTFKPISG